MKKIFPLFLCLLPLIGNAQMSDALKLRVVSGSYQDETVVRFTSGATENYDGSYDAFKFFSPNPAVPSIFTRLSNGWEMAINSFPGLSQSWSFPIYIKSPAAGNYQIEAEFLGLFSGQTGIMLENNNDGTVTSLTANNSFQVYLPFDTSGLVPAFTLWINFPPSVTLTQPSCFDASNGSAIVSVINDSILETQLTRIADQYKLQSTPNGLTDTVAGISTGSYLLEVEFASGYIFKDSLLVEGPDPLPLDISASLTNISQDSATVQFTAQSNPGVQVAWDFGDGATGNGNNVSHFFSGIQTYLITAIAMDSSFCTVMDSVEVELNGSPVGTFEQAYLNKSVIYQSGNNILIKGRDGQQIQAYSLEGKLVWAGHVNGNYVTGTNGWPAGIYLFVGTGENSFSERVLVR